jgi:hypothetical protein
MIVGEHPWNWGRFVPFWDEKVNEIMKHLDEQPFKTE